MKQKLVHPVTWNFLMDKYKKLHTMAVLFSSSAQRVVCIIKATYPNNNNVNKITEPLDLDPLFTD